MWQNLNPDSASFMTNVTNTLCDGQRVRKINVTATTRNAENKKMAAFFEALILIYATLKL